MEEEKELLLSRQERIKKAKKLRSDRIWKYVGFAIVGVQAAITIVFGIFLAILNMVPLKYFIPGIIVLAVLTIVLFFMQLRRVPGIVAKVISVLLSACLIIGTLYVAKTSSALGNLANKTEVIQENIYVLADSPAQSVNDTKGYKFGILSVIDRSNTDQVVTELSTTLGEEITCKEYLTPVELAEGLYANDVDALILNYAYVSMIIDHEGYENFETQTRVISTKTLQNDIAQAPVVPVGEFEKQDFFVVYISGIDTYSGEVLANSRSDVNILLCANKKTKQILLLSTPRDTYTYIPAYDYKDKLTHAGNAGISSSMDTLKEFYDIDIDYYFKVNFKGFESIVDSLGGIEIYSEKEFRSTSDSSYKGHIFHYDKGYNYLDGEQALVFARERHAFADGDFQRGRDQMIVIQGIFKKLLSAKILTSYSSLLDDLQNYFKTDFSSAEISSLVKMQLEDGASWKFDTYTIEGDGKILSGSGKWVLMPYNSSIEKAKSLIQTVKDGGIIEETDTDSESTVSD